MTFFAKYRDHLIGGFIAVMLVGFVVISQFLPQNSIITPQPSITPNPNIPTPIRLPEVKMPTIRSCDELKEKLSKFSQTYPPIMMYDMMGKAGAPASPTTNTESRSSDFSKTNVQVEGVDEADIIKTDGNYIYSLANGKLHIIKAGEPPEKVSTLTLQDSEQAREIFVETNSLMIIGNKNRSMLVPQVFNKMGISMPYYGRQVTFVKIYNISQKNNPVLQRALEFDSSYLTSRLIQGNMYMVLTKNAMYGNNSVDSALPQYADGTNAADSLRPMAKCTDVSYADPVLDAQYLTIVSIPTNPLNRNIEKKIVLGTGQTFYASHYNLYTAATKYKEGVVGGYQLEVPYQESSEYTRIHKFNLIDGKITHVAEGEVEGRLLNQFSMDEHDNYLRLATTIGHVSQQGSATDNRIYVLDARLKPAGSITGIAPGEQIYSARFMGKRGYLVTFKKVDPFFTLDLSDPRNPRVAGQLKIPGFSDYLHPYDENHIIGVGKETIESEGGNFAWYQGLKMAIFDVTDFNNPKELHRIIIGDRGSDSPVLTDHKAFLFSLEKNLLVIPATVALIDDAQKQGSPPQFPAYGKPSFQGALVYSIDLNNGFQEKTRIAHSSDSNPYTGYPVQSNITRSLYIGNMLYTISNNKIQAHRLSDFVYIGEINLAQ